MARIPAVARYQSRARRVQMATAALVLSVVIGGCRTEDEPVSNGSSSSVLRVGVAQLSETNPLIGIRQLSQNLAFEGIARIGEDGRGDIDAVTAPCRDCQVVSKVIIEAALLTDDEKVTACTLAKAAGADYVKTSTGFGPGGATPADVALMRRVVGATMGVKAAGGIRDLEAVKAMVAAGATRVGASASVRIVKEASQERSGSVTVGGY